MAVTSGSGRYPSPAKPSPIAMVPISPRQKWPKGLVVFSPRGSSRWSASQTKITGIAKKDRKNTVWPAGTCWAVALIIEAMTMKTRTEASLKAMPRRGRMGHSAKVTATRRRTGFQVP